MNETVQHAAVAARAVADAVAGSGEVAVLDEVLGVALISLEDDEDRRTGDVVDARVVQRPVRFARIQRRRTRVAGSTGDVAANEYASEEHESGRILPTRRRVAVTVLGRLEEVVASPKAMP